MSKQTSTIEFEQEVQDSITGFIGVVTAKCEYVDGRVQYLVTPSKKHNPTATFIVEYPKEQWIDGFRLVVNE